MATFKDAVLTKKGLALLAKAQAGQTDIHFTKAASGSGSYGPDERLSEREGLKEPRQETSFERMTVINDIVVLIRFLISNEQASGNLQEGYYMKEVGIFAQDPNEGEILYAIATAVEDQWDYMPPYNGLMPAYITMEFYTEVCNAANVTIVCSGTFMTVEDAEKRFEELERLMQESTRGFVTTEDAEVEHTKLKKMIEDAGKVLEGVLTEKDKGVKSGVASLDSSGHIPRAQLPYGSGAEYFGDKIDFKHFTWKAIEGYTGWVGTYVSFYQDDGRFSDLIGRYWSEMLLSIDPDRLYNMYIESYADHLASVFSSLHFKAFVKIGDDKSRTIKVFADSDLGTSEAAEVAFWPYVLRRGKPDY